jgi:hypothetical protein
MKPKPPSAARRKNVSAKNFAPPPAEALIALVCKSRVPQCLHAIQMYTAVPCTELVGWFNLRSRPYSLPTTVYRSLRSASAITRHMHHRTYRRGGTPHWRVGVVWYDRRGDMHQRVARGGLGGQLAAIARPGNAAVRWGRRPGAESPLKTSRAGLS